MKRKAPFERTEYFDYRPDVFSCAWSCNRRDWVVKNFDTYEDALKYLEEVPKEYRYQRVYRRKQHSAIVSNKLYERVIPL